MILAGHAAMILAGPRILAAPAPMILVAGRSDNVVSAPREEDPRRREAAMPLRDDRSPAEPATDRPPAEP